jgi:RNA recognition motif-containing protein
VTSSSGSNRVLTRNDRYGFVTFNNMEEAARALEAANGLTFNGRRIVVSYGGKRATLDAPYGDAAPKEPTSTLFVGNLAYTMTDKDLNDLFRPLRKICDVRVAVDRRTGQPRGFAHADFLDVQSAVEAKNALQGKLVHDRELKLDFAITRERPVPRKPLEELIAEEEQSRAIESGAVDAETNTAAFATEELVEAEEGNEEVISQEIASEEETKGEEEKAQSTA